MCHPPPLVFHWNGFAPTTICLDEIGHPEEPDLLIGWINLTGVLEMEEMINFELGGEKLNEISLAASPKGAIATVPIERRYAGSATLVSDTLAVEEPLEIRLDYVRDQTRIQKSISITMRTPGHDFELAVGFLFTEGLLRKREDVVTVKHCGPPLAHLGHSNVVKVEFRDDVRLDLKSLERHFYTSSSCGVCGKSSIDALRVQSSYANGTAAAQTAEFSFSAASISLFPELVRRSQSIFEQTGGLHASALFSQDGILRAIREDVGRHNALDKLIGAAFLRDEFPLSRHLLFLSGRVSFELVQKAAMAGIRIIAAVGAPSSLAVELAREMNITLLGFVKHDRFNIYHGEWRVR